MFNRRSFLKATGTLAAASMLPQLTSANSLFSPFFAKYPPIGLQTYTLQYLFNDKAVDTKSVLQQIAAIGVKELETASGSAEGLYYGHTPKEFAAMVNDLGMKWVGNHFGGLPRKMTTPSTGPQRINLRDNLQQIIDNSAEGGCSWVICASSSEADMDEIKKTTEIFSAAGEKAAQSKMKFAYHNHQSEFTKIDGVSAYEYVLGQTNKDQVFMELDLAWATQAGMDPVAMFKQYPGRFPLWHVKDIDPATGRPCVVGKGKVEFKRIFENSKLSGVQHTFIEQDGAKTIADPAESVKWLKANL
ncbi:MAG: Xylose isomerase [Pedobacter sp.]|jgi:sugar phosphate isomerase/epimerase|nr:Xylose isomerase [Pedobacter sp.]